MSFQAMTWATEQYLPAMQKIVLLMLANCTNHHTGRCDPSHEFLAAECGMSVRAVKDQIKKLEAVGLLTVIPRKQGSVNLPNQYRLNIHPLRDDVGVGQELPEGGAGAAPGVGQELPTNQEVKPGSKPNTPPALVYERFDLFWSAYPRKQGKEAARRAFVKLGPGESLLLTMLDALHKQKRSDQWRKDGGQFIPNPATWLNQHRWEDEIAVADKPKGLVL